MGPSSGDLTTGPSNRVLQVCIKLCSHHIEGHLDVKTSCSLIMETFQGLQPDMGSFIFCCLFVCLFFLLHEYVIFCFLKTMKSAHFCLTKCMP